MMCDEIEDILLANPGATIQLDNDAWYLVDKHDELIYSGYQLIELWIALASIAGIHLEMV